MNEMVTVAQFEPADAAKRQRTRSDLMNEMVTVGPWVWGVVLWVVAPRSDLRELEVTVGNYSEIPNSWGGAPGAT